MSTTPNQPREPEPEPTPQQPGEETADTRDALEDIKDKPHSDEVGETAYSAVPPPLPSVGDPAQGPVQDAAPGASGQPQTGFAAPGSAEQPQQSPYQQTQQPYQQQPSYGSASASGGEYAGAHQGAAQGQYGEQGQYGDPQYGGQYGGAQYGDPQYGDSQYGGSQPPGGQYPGSAGPYQAAPPPPYGQAYGYPGGGLPAGMPPLASWGQRATAFLLDNGVAVVAGWIAGSTRNNTVDVVVGLIGLVGVVWAIVNAVRAGRTGQSYGKRTMGIRLARLSDGQPIGGGLGFLRLFLNWLFWVACIIPGVLNLLWPLWDTKNQTWCDKIAKSVVVKA